MSFILFKASFETDTESQIEDLAINADHVCLLVGPDGLDEGEYLTNVFLTGGRGVSVIGTPEEVAKGLSTPFATFEDDEGSTLYVAADKVRSVLPLSGVPEYRSQEQVSLEFERGLKADVLGTVAEVTAKLNSK